MMVTIHQPCYLPYLGIFHKIWKADVFAYLDDAQYSNGYVFEWNRIKTPQGECRLKVPLEKNFGDTLRKVLPKDFLGWQKKHLKTIEMNYKKAPYFAEFFPLLEKMLMKHYNSLADLNVTLMNLFMEWFGWKKPVYFTSDMELESRAEARVIEIQEASSQTECRPFLRIAALMPWIRVESAGSLIFIHSGLRSRASRSVATFFNRG